MVQGPCTCDIATWVPQLLGPTWQWHDWAAFSALFKQRIKFLALSGQTTVRRQNMQTKDSVENRNRPRHSVSNLLLVMPVFFFSQIRNAQCIDRPFSERRAPVSAHPVQEWQKTADHAHPYGRRAGRLAACRHGTTLTTMYSRELEDV
jgi:hypothetical protein